MPAIRPYQPSLLRVLHACMVMLVPLAWLSGFLVYSNHDGRWGRLPWPIPGDWIDIHGTIGVALWPLALLFAFYALTLGRARLNHQANAAALLALAMAVGSGKLMNEDWLREGQLHHLAYSLHLTGWLVMAGAVIWHLRSLLRKGGVQLVRSIFDPLVRRSDQPHHWPAQIMSWFRR